MLFLSSPTTFTRFKPSTCGLQATAAQCSDKFYYFSTDLLDNFPIQNIFLKHFSALNKIYVTTSSHLICFTSLDGAFFLPFCYFVAVNQFEEFQRSDIQLFASLVHLSAQGNYMTWLHPDITTLYRLEYLNLSENDLIYLPNDLNKLTSLKGKCYFIVVEPDEPTHLSLDVLKMVLMIVMPISSFLLMKDVEKNKI